MLSAVIRSALGYPAFTVGTITGILAVHPSRSSRTMEGSSQCSNAYTGYGPNCLTHVIPNLSKRHGLYLHPQKYEESAFYISSNQMKYLDLFRSKSLQGINQSKKSNSDLTTAEVMVRFFESFKNSNLSTNSQHFKKESRSCDLDLFLIICKARTACFRLIFK